MSTAIKRVISTISRRLILRSVTTGAFVGLTAGIGFFFITYAQATLDSERFAGWSMNPGQLGIFAFGGAIVGTRLGLTGGCGALLLLRARAASTQPGRVHYAGTAGLGAGAATAACTVLAFFSAGTVLWASVGAGVCLGAVAAFIAAFHTRRLIPAIPSQTG